MKKLSLTFLVLVLGYVAVSLVSTGEASADGWSPKQPATLITADGGTTIAGGTITTKNVVINGSPLLLDGGTISIAEGFGGHYEGSAPQFIPIDPAYFGASGTTVIRYVNTVSGASNADTVCDGKSAATGTTRPCAWKSVQRWLDDFPDGYTATPLLTLAAETILGTQTWILHSLPANNSTTPTIQGFTGTPQATFSTTGTGAFSTTTAGSGKTGGVTSDAQVTFTPGAGVATGSIPNTIADADFFFATTVAATGIMTVRTVMASSGGALTLNTRATTAITTPAPALYPWATTCSGSVTIVSVFTRGSSPALGIAGVKFAGALNLTNVTLRGVYATGSVSLTSSSLSSGNYLSPSSGISATCGYPSGCAITDSVVNGQTFEMRGPWASLIGGVFKGSQAYKLSLGASVVGTNFGGTFVTSVSGCDFEGSTATAAIRLMGPVTFGTGNMSSAGAPPNCGSSQALTFDITGSPLLLDYGATFMECGSTVGKYTNASQVHQGSSVLLRGTWSATNVSTATQEWVVGPGASFFQASDLPVRDIVENATVSNGGYNTTSTTSRVEGPLIVLGASTLAGATAATYSTVANCADSAGAAGCGSAAAGMFVLDAAATTVVVSTTAVTANSEIKVWQDQSEGTRLSVTCNTTNLRQYKVTTRVAGTSFTVGAFDFATGAALGPVSNPDCLSFTLTN